MSTFIIDSGNFTPKQRTPWAGKQIWESLKQHLPGLAPQTDIGEAWEFSFDESFPSRVKGTHQLLLDALTPIARSVFGKDELERVGCFSEILLKVIHAARPLSVQVHPDDSYKGLSANECGKPESWLVLDAKEGAGVYLGFSKQISKDELRIRLEEGQNIEDFLNFVPVKKGDYFELRPGVVHALGSDVLVLEPQRVRYGRSGKTYRLYDWGLLYNLQGLPDSLGKARELHVAQALDQFDPVDQLGNLFVETVKKSALSRHLDSGMVLSQYPKTMDYQLFRLVSEGGRLQTIDREAGYLIVYVTDGSLQVTDRSGTTFRLLRGETILVGEDSFPAKFHLNGEACLLFSRGSSPIFLD